MSTNWRTVSPVGQLLLARMQHLAVVESLYSATLMEWHWLVARRTLSETSSAAAVLTPTECRLMEDERQLCRKAGMYRGCWRQLGVDLMRTASELC